MEVHEETVQFILFFVFCFLLLTTIVQAQRTFLYIHQFCYFKKTLWSHSLAQHVSLYINQYCFLKEKSSGPIHSAHNIFYWPSLFIYTPTSFYFLLKNVFVICHVFLTYRVTKKKLKLKVKLKVKLKINKNIILGLSLYTQINFRYLYDCIPHLI